MSTVRAWRIVDRDYKTLYPRQEDPAIVTEPPGEVAGPFFLARNPWRLLLRTTLMGPGPAGGGNHKMLLCTYQTGDVLEHGSEDRTGPEHGGDRHQQPAEAGGPWSGDLVYVDNEDPVPDGDRPYSMAWAEVSSATFVDELAYLDASAIQARPERHKLDEVLEILDSYGWGDWEPARV